MAKPYFDPVNPKVNFPSLEREILDYWYKKGIVKKYLQKNKTSKKYFSFLDGPITANNPMGVHHAWGRTYKDLWQRYKNMKGYKQRFQNGFDCQGLWVEVEVEKELKLKSKKDIENLVSGDRKKSIDKFVRLCKARVFKYAKIQTEQSKRLGFFMDWDNSYFTLSDDNNYMIWHFLKVCHENGWIYKGEDVSAWCPRCQTAISQHEILTEDYKDVVHKSIYLKLAIEGKKNEFLLVWTTTPWTLPANTATAVDQNLDYSLVKAYGQKYWVAKDAIERVFAKKAEIVRNQKGSNLVGLKYKSPYDYLPFASSYVKTHKDGFHTVVATDNLIMPITVEEGTGLVHTSTSTGQEDYKLGRKIGLPTFPAINDKGEYLEGFADLVGKNAKETPEIILNYLEKEGWVFKIEKYKHRYPVCWRCKQELVWKISKEWYIAMDRSSSKVGMPSRLSLRQRMIKVTKKINWIPSFGLERELDWLNNMQDWLISKKNRYWGLCLPIWECEKCGHFEVVGSKEELRQKTVSGWGKFEGKSPHKPQLDEVKIKCQICDEVISRIEPVGTPWLDAGIVAYSTISEINKSATLGGGEKPLYFKDKEKWKDWFPADFITESFPGQFKNWFYSLIAMSTVLENKEPFSNVLGFATLLAEDGRPMHKSWGNAIEFNEGAEKIGVDVMRFLFARQSPEDNLLFGYRIADEVRRRFHLKLWNVYNFFTTYANLDGWKPEEKFDIENKDLRNILDKWIVSRLYETVLGINSHLDNYDAQNASWLIENFIEDLSNWYIRRSRSRVGLMASSNKDKENFYQTCFLILVNLSKLLAPFIPFLAEDVYRNLTKEESVHLSDWPKLVGKKDVNLIKEMKRLRNLVEIVHAQRKLKGIPVRRPLLSFSTNFKSPGSFLEKLIKEEVNVKGVKWGSLIGDGIRVKLDTKLTEELEEEMKVRELIRKIQKRRKEMVFDLREKAVVASSWFPKKRSLLQKIKKATLTEELVKGKFEIKRLS
ncbi:isoleucine--tRNA ligase [Candidatus Woesebacteria bacterium RIFCSPHIGHO2_01_FULL_38_10]|uniref:Isoleucine--tRNA ligase n=1 Tax=Candidatus Woesebacteria bacterium RIFCSPLOWO2_01_FULL_39_10b TaxID=1802517 RepID=A0A1F8B9W6_9BACT|nr:MAG: isoleucine--tRNA ligase [Candidatus Woesebacteria bacterium RIFCSPHIGHO2_01_FULL_38_10]OGM60138.1 MAG: isoleucine--tRNA ligase [Candidatus Woesebacteria bacterium RIFCSPLOWO2_01_FULL_39_10b]